MALTNAEKQAAWRRRRNEQVKLLQGELDRLRNQQAMPDTEELQRLRAEVADLRAQLRAQQAASAPSDGELSGARKLIEELRAQRDIDTKGKRLATEALAEAAKVQRTFVAGLRRIDTKIALLAEYMPDKIAALRRKVQARIDRGSTEGERTAAREIMKRLPRPDVEKFAPEPEPLPATREEMLARKRVGRNRPGS